MKLKTIIMHAGLTNLIEDIVISVQFVLTFYDVSAYTHAPAKRVDAVIVGVLSRQLCLRFTINRQMHVDSAVCDAAINTDAKTQEIDAVFLRRKDAGLQVDGQVAVGDVKVVAYHARRRLAVDSRHTERRRRHRTHRVVKTEAHE